jgi:hypothetical protein
MKDICVEWTGHANNLASVSEKLGAAGVNIEGLCLAKSGELTIIHFLVEDAATAVGVLENAGIRTKGVSEVYIICKDPRGITGKPGSFGQICRMLEENGIGINFGYPAENNRFVFGVDDVKKVSGLLG